MADIFISYARGDREKVEKLALALETGGHSVWWDRHIAGGAEFSKEIEQELNAAKAVIVAWSREANDSRWVKDEAGIAANAGKLIAVGLDGEEPPIGFKQFHVIDYVHASDAALNDIKRSVALKLGRALTEEPSPFTTPARRAPIRNLLIAAVIAIGVLALGYVVYNNVLQRSPGNSADVASAGDYRSIAVLAFSDLSPERDQEYFSDGIAEELLNLLAKKTDLRVAARTSSFAFKGANESVNAIGEALNVDAVLEGSVRKAGENVRITAQLIDTRSGYHLWSETYHRRLSDIFAVQDEIAHSIVDAIPTVMMQEGESADSPSSSAAYELYLQGKHQLTLRTPASIAEARRLFEEATALDPNFAAAWAGRATAYVLQRDSSDSYGDLSYEEELALAKPAVERALALDPVSDEALAALGLLHFHGNDFESAEEALRRAVEINPSSINARNWLHSALFASQRYQEAFAQVKRAAEIDPLSAIILENLVNTHVSLGEYEDAVAVAERNVALHPEWPVARASLGYAYFSASKFAEALAAEDDVFEMPGMSFGVYGNVVFRMALMGHFDEVILAEAPWYALSFTRLIQGRDEEARALVNGAYQRAAEPLLTIPRVAWTLWALGDEEEARTLFEEYAIAQNRPPLVSNFDCYPGIHIAALRKRAGDEAGARPLIEACRRVLETQAREGMVLPYYRANTPAELLLLEGKRDEAIAHLRANVENRRSADWWLAKDPAWADIKDDPRFVAVADDIKAMVNADREKYLRMKSEDSQ